MANDPGQFKRASYMALAGFALILVVTMTGGDVLQTSVGIYNVPEAGLGLRLKQAADSLRPDTIARTPTTKASGPRPRIALRDSSTTIRNTTSRRVAAAIEELRQRQLLLPLPGLTPDRVRDSFNQARSGGARRHNAIDLFAPRGTPILAADSGIVLKLNRSTLGGIQLYAADPNHRFVYYYAHLDAYHPSIEEGMSIARGDTLGFVGTTGNAPASSPHLHFAIYRTDNIERWFSGTPINPRDVFRPR